MSAGPVRRYKTAAEKSLVAKKKKAAAIKYAQKRAFMNMPAKHTEFHKRVVHDLDPMSVATKKMGYEHPVSAMHGYMHQHHLMGHVVRSLQGKAGVAQQILQLCKRRLMQVLEDDNAPVKDWMKAIDRAFKMLDSDIESITERAVKEDAAEESLENMAQAYLQSVTPVAQVTSDEGKTDSAETES